MSTSTLSAEVSITPAEPSTSPQVFPEVAPFGGVRRRASREQGRALELLGHAIEYLADSRMFSGPESLERTQAEGDAMQMLMKASREVFNECPESMPFHQRVTRWISSSKGKTAGSGK